MGWLIVIVIVIVVVFWSNWENRQDRNRAYRDIIINEGEILSKRINSGVDTKELNTIGGKVYFNGNLFSGVANKVDPGGSLVLTETYLNGNKHGAFMSWPSDEVYRKGRYSNGDPDGHWDTFDRETSLHVNRSTYRKGSDYVMFEEYFPNGNVRRSIQSIWRFGPSGDIVNIAQGECKEFYENGALLSVSQYKMSLPLNKSFTIGPSFPIGITKFFDKSGNLISTKEH